MTCLLFVRLNGRRIRLIVQHWARPVFLVFGARVESGGPKETAYSWRGAKPAAYRFREAFIVAFHGDAEPLGQMEKWMFDEYSDRQKKNLGSTPSNVTVVQISNAEYVLK